MMKKQFETESKRILDLMIHSIYTNKEIFLRELISNASDAIDKRYFNSIKSGKSLDKKDLEIFIELDKNNRTITISDNGIGMTKEDLENNLGTIAKSGSLDFKTLNKDDEISIIGQFGVGFYSSFMVADKIEVKTKSEGGEALSWISEGAEGYEIIETSKDEIGTEIKLYMKENTEDDNFEEYLNQGFIRYLVKKYSNYIKYPIKMNVEKSKPGEDGNTENYTEEEVLNSMIPIWKKNKNDVTDEEYKNFYHAQRYGFDDPLAWIHLSAEGIINYKSILYIPSQKPFEYYTSNFTGGLELYSNGVMIMEKNEDLLPSYLSFVKGIVDSEDLSLNISREILQNDRRMVSISKNLEKKVLSELKSILNSDKQRYGKFFEEFGLSLKAGIYESQGAKKKEIEDLLLFKTSKSKEMVTLEKYLDNKKEDQEFIYYATGESYENIDSMPALQMLKKKDIEVIYLDEHIDEFVIKVMESYRDIKFKSAFDEEIELEDNSEKEDKKEDVNQKELFNKMKEVLGDEIVDIKASKRLVDDASFLTSKGDISIEMEKTLSMQQNPMGIKAQKVLEINPNHILYKKLMESLSVNDTEKISLITNVLYNQARLISGLKVDDIVKFTQDVNSLIK
ncbi:molecular chaperone HtpG [Helcococcus ovis]|uniref:Chaperone protein HtpG n=4 Tax=Peptoniphilaceae TaxID=1570339 RepID=A0A4R9C272_9FIRM|nr:molecular chaperone HtpG [Helcococcus ovis]TFF66980.1 molecular chaperone HtpG [Helcococcus ovis]